MSTTDFDRTEALKDLENFFDKEKRIDLKEEDMLKLQDTAKFAWTQIEQTRQDPASFEESRNNLTSTGIVDAAFTRGNRTFLFSGNQYFVYTDDYEVADFGYPKEIRANTEGIPPVNRIDAAFDVNGETFFFIGGGRSFVRRSRLDTVESVVDRFGFQDSVFESTELRNIPVQITAAFTDLSGRTYFVAGDRILRYSGAGRDAYQFMDEDFEMANDFALLLAELGATNIDDQLSGVRISASFRNGDEITFGTIKTSSRERGTFVFSLQDQSLTALSPQQGEENLFAGFTLETITFRFFRNTLEFEEANGNTQEFTDLDRSINGALAGVDGNIYLFSGNEFITISNLGTSLNPIGGGPIGPIGPIGSLNSIRIASTIRGFIQNWDNLSQPISSKWGMTASLIGQNGIVDTAFFNERTGKLFLFSGREYVRYSVDLSQPDLIARFPDEGYPQQLQDNPDHLPHRILRPSSDPSFNQIQAAFSGFDGQAYFFSNRSFRELPSFVSQDHNSRIVSEPQLTNDHWGNTPVFAEKPDGEFIGSAFMFENFTYLLTDSEFIKFENGGDGFLDLTKQAFMSRQMEQMFAQQKQDIKEEHDNTVGRITVEVEKQGVIFHTVLEKELSPVSEKMEAIEQNTQQVSQQATEIRAEQQNFRGDHFSTLNNLNEQVQKILPFMDNRTDTTHQGIREIQDKLSQMGISDLNLQLLHMVEERTERQGDGRISESDAQEIIAFAQQGENGSINEKDMRTLSFILAKHHVTRGGKAVLLNAMLTEEVTTLP